MMISSANAYLAAAWDQFILVADHSPRSIFAGILAVLTVLVCIAIISLFSRLRSLKTRNRQLAENVETLSARLEETRAGLDAKISELSADRAREAPASAPKDKERELPAALMREELVSLQLDLRAPEERTETPATEENS